MSRLICRIAAVLFLLAATVAAQTNANSWNAVKALAAGTEVRITAGSRTVRGTIDRVTDDTLVVTTGTSQELFDRQQIMRVSARAKGHRGRNALIGLGVGAGVGFGVGAAADGGCIRICGGENLGKVLLTPMGAIAGVLVGALVPTGGWRAIYQK